MKCCFCGEELEGIGNSPYPFFVYSNNNVGCCNNCNAYITPFRGVIKKSNISTDELERIANEIIFNLELQKKD